jgi:hypothetical protein
MIMNRFTLSRRYHPGTKRPARARPVLELLEDRTVLSTLTVLNALDSGAGSLRDAIKAASSGDMIQFDSGLSGQTITLTSGELAITKSLDIEGPTPGSDGKLLLAISGNNASRVFNVSQNQKPVVVTIAMLTIEYGLNSGIAEGGGILNVSSTLTLTNDVLSDNVALGHSNGTAGEGGAIANWGGILMVTGCTFTGNQALGSNGGGKGQAGAILNARRGTAGITYSTFTNNLARGGDNATGISSKGAESLGEGRAGAIYNNSQMTIEHCTFDGNQAIGNNAAPPTKTVQMAIGKGGAIYNYGGYGGQ